MPQAEETKMLKLVPIDLPNLRRLAASEPVDLYGMDIVDGALPPPRVAAHALAQADIGTPTYWCAPFLIVSQNTILGTCRFRAAPEHGRVEIGYEVAESQRGRGVATAAVEQLLKMAASSGLVQQVVAHIVPGNVASAKVVSRLGFSLGDSFVDSDGEAVMRWSSLVAT